MFCQAFGVNFMLCAFCCKVVSIKACASIRTYSVHVLTQIHHYTAEAAGRSGGSRHACTLRLTLMHNSYSNGLGWATDGNNDWAVCGNWVG